MASTRHISEQDASRAPAPVAATHAAVAAPAAPAATTAGVVLAAARSLALDVGFRRATIADVARRAGVSRMTVYREFDDIDAIWSRLLTDELVGLIDQAAAALVDLPTARARIVAVAAVLARAVPDHPLFRRALEVDPELLLPLVVDRFGSSQRAALTRLEVLLAAGQADGSVREDLDSQAAAAAVLLAAQSFVFSARALDTRPDPDAVRNQLPEMLDRYLAP